MLERVDEIFTHALTLEGGERAAYLDGACAGDAPLREQVESLIEAHEGRGEFLGALPRETADLPVDERPLGPGRGEMIGRYRLLQQIGEGGFGVVWMAEQREPVRRRVALKIIKLGMDTEQVIARFEAERQALAMLDHPNIARVLDAGSTETGRPYFVMEYIRGVPIVEYCDSQMLDTRARLDLFAHVCLAIQHAHQKGIIHRDIKPNNVLVTLHDGEPVPKVIDFGIAKATNQELTNKTLFTAHRQLIGTPAYMSPEQAEMSGLDIDTRTDVYALGVLLYELLTGSTPFPNEELLSKGFVEMMRVIREVDPPKPSTRLSESIDALPGVAASRRTEPRKLGVTVRGELDWIVMKALEKNRVRRYDSASGLAADIRRHLAGETVEAAPPSRLYQLQKIVRRNRGMFVAGGLVALALLVGLVAFAWQARIAGIERGRAMVQRNEAVEARALADARAEDLATVAAFQEDMLRSIRAWAAGGHLTDGVVSRYSAALERTGVPEAEREARAREFAEHWKYVNAADVAIDLIDTQIMQPAVGVLDKRFGDKPVIDAALRQRLASMYRNLSLFEQARPLQERALELRRRELGPEHPDTLQSMADTAGLLTRLGRRADTLVLREQVLEGRTRALGPEHPDTLRALSVMGETLRGLGRDDEAEEYLRETVRLRRKVLGDAASPTVLAILHLAELLRDVGRLGEAEPLFREAVVARRRMFGDEHTNSILAMAWHGAVLRDLGRAAEADAALGQAMERYRHGVAEDRAGVRAEWQPAGGLSDRLAAIYARWGDYAEAEQLYRDSIDRKLRSFGESNQFTIAAISRLGAALLEQGKTDEAEPFVLDGLERAQRLLGNEDETTRYAVAVMADLLLSKDRPAEAELYASRALDAERRLRREDHRVTVAALARLAECRHALERRTAARDGFDEAIAMQRRLTPSGSADLARVLLAAGGSRLEGGEPSAALALLEEAAQLAERWLPPGHPQLAEFDETLRVCREAISGNG